MYCAVTAILGPFSSNAGRAHAWIDKEAENNGVVSSLCTADEKQMAKGIWPSRYRVRENIIDSVKSVLQSLLHQT